jgi:hypothetical protein
LLPAMESMYPCIHECFYQNPKGLSSPIFLTVLSGYLSMFGTHRASMGGQVRLPG